MSAPRPGRSRVWHPDPFPDDDPFLPATRPRPVVPWSTVVAWAGLAVVVGVPCWYLVFVLYRWWLG